MPSRPELMLCPSQKFAGIFSLILYVVPESERRYSGIESAVGGFWKCQDSQKQQLKSICKHF